MPSSQTRNNQQKKTKGLIRFLPLVLIVLIIAGLVILTNLMRRTIPNDPNAPGNTACNLQNGGFFCQDGDTIYFSNMNDDGALYSMDTSLGNYRKIHSDMAGYLNVTSHYLVYARLNYMRDGGGKAVLDYTNTGLFRINKKKGSGTRMIYGKPVGATVLYGNDIYYQHYDKTEGIDLYRASLDCKTNVMISDSTLVPTSIHDGYIYYTGTEKDHFIYRMLPGSLSAPTLLYEGNCYQAARVGSSIYFFSLSNDYSLARVDEYGGNPTLLVQERCSAYNVSDDEAWLIYQIDNGERNRLECLNMQTLEKTVVAEGNYCNIHIVGGMVFFQSFGGTSQYYFPLGRPAEMQPFEPPVLSK